MCLSPAEVPCVVITSVLLFKSISYYVIPQICFCIRKHLCVLISFFFAKKSRFLSFVYMMSVHL